MVTRTASHVVFACHDAACRPPRSGGTGGSSSGKGSKRRSGLPPFDAKSDTSLQAWFKVTGSWGSATVDTIVRPGGSRATLTVISGTVNAPAPFQAPDQWGTYRHSAEIGSFKRTLREVSPGKFEVVHSELFLDGVVHGKGIADDLYSTWMQRYKDSGAIQGVLVSTTQVGGYAWARQGFDVYEASPGDRVRVINDMLHWADDEISSHVGYSLTADQGHRVEQEIAALRKANASGEIVQPRHVAAIGSKYTWQDLDDWGNKRTYWVGKSALLNTNWDGYKVIERGVTASSRVGGMALTLTSHLVFACHEASCRPPTSGGTGGSKGGGIGPLHTSVVGKDTHPKTKASDSHPHAPGHDDVTAVRGHKGLLGNEPERRIPRKGETVDAYRDLGHGKEFKRGFPDGAAMSVRHAAGHAGDRTGLVVASTTGMVVDNARPAWAAAAKKGAELTGKRGVHAFIRGEVHSYQNPEALAAKVKAEGWQKVTYYPGTQDFFHPETRKRFLGAEQGALVNGEFYAKNPKFHETAPKAPVSAIERKMGWKPAPPKAEPIPRSGKSMNLPDMSPVGAKQVIRAAGITRTKFKNPTGKTITIHEGSDVAIRAAHEALTKKFADPRYGFEGGTHYDWGSGKLVSWESPK